MNYYLIIIILVTNFAKSEENFVRMSIVPEYEQNLVTTLFSFNRIIKDESQILSFTLPDDIDSVYLINRSSNNQLGFTSVNFYMKDGFNWVDVPNTDPENAYMITSKKYQQKGIRDFNYQLMFSEKIEQIDIELEEPLVAEKFRYNGIDWEDSINEKGQKIYKNTYISILKDQPLNLFFEYINVKGNTSKSILEETLNSPSVNNLKLTERRKTVSRYNLYIWESLLALFIITVLIILILITINNRNNMLKCKKCGLFIKKDDLFCSKCGEKK